MPVPKRKVSKARRDKRSANKGMKKGVVIACQTCGAPALPHQICKSCGHYKGVKVLKTKTDRMYERSKVRQANQQANQAAHKDTAEQAPASK